MIGDGRLGWECDFSTGWISGRHVANHWPGRYDVRDHAFVAAAGARFQYGDPSNWYRHLFFSFQPTYNTGRTMALSSAYEFTSSIGWQSRRFSVQIRHISNGGTHEPNRGETMALVGIVF
ncbi:acyloxyacyl hydrolase [Rhodanobacter sp. BL-MT-08]